MHAHIHKHSLTVMWGFQQGENIWIGACIHAKVDFQLTSEASRKGSCGGLCLWEEKDTKQGKEMRCMHAQNENDVTIQAYIPTH